MRVWCCVALSLLAVLILAAILGRPVGPTSGGSTRVELDIRPGEILEFRSVRFRDGTSGLVVFRKHPSLLHALVEQLRTLFSRSASAGVQTVTYQLRESPPGSLDFDGIFADQSSGR